MHHKENIMETDPKINPPQNAHEEAVTTLHKTKFLEDLLNNEKEYADPRLNELLKAPDLLRMYTALEVAVKTKNTTLIAVAEEAFARMIRDHDGTLPELVLAGEATKRIQEGLSRGK